MVRKTFGLAMLLVGLSGITVSVMGARLGYQVIDDIGAELLSSLNLLSASLDNARDSLLLAKVTAVDVSSGMETLETATLNIGVTIDGTQPLLAAISKIASEDVPGSLETMQEALPSVVQVAGVVDDTLTTLNNFRIDERILGIRIQYDLGIDYDPAVPFDESINQIGHSLEGLPPSLRGLKSRVEVTSSNMDMLSQDILDVAGDLANLNDRIRQVDPLLDEYLRIVTDVNDATLQVRNQVDDKLENAKQVLTLLTIWLGLAQIAPLYLGWELLRGRRLR